MTHVSTPNVGTLPRPRAGKLGSIAVVIALGAALGFGIASTGDEVATGNPSANTFTAQREGTPRPADTNAADRGYFETGAALIAGEASKGGLAEQTGQPR